MMKTVNRRREATVVKIVNLIVQLSESGSSAPEKGPS